MMGFIEQLRARRNELHARVAEIAERTGMAQPNVYRMLAGGRDLRASSLEAFASALDAQWVLVPSGAVDEVGHLLSDKAGAGGHEPEEAPPMHNMDGRGSC